ncbi:hypothetical protein D3C86_1089540 [compost metagenome]
MIGDRIVVQLRNTAFLGADAAGEIAEVVDSQRNIGGQGLTHRLAVVPGFGLGHGLKIDLDAVGDTIEDKRALGDAGLAPGVLGGMGGVQRQLDVGRVRASHLAQDAAVHRGGVLEIAAVDRSDPLAADEVVVARLEPGGRGADEFGLGHGKSLLLVSSGVDCSTSFDASLVGRGRSARRRRNGAAQTCRRIATGQCRSIRPRR